MPSLSDLIKKAKGAISNAISLPKDDIIHVPISRGPDGKLKVVGKPVKMTTVPPPPTPRMEDIPTPTRTPEPLPITETMKNTADAYKESARIRSEQRKERYKTLKGKELAKAVAKDTLGEVLPALQYLFQQPGFKRIATLEERISSGAAGYVQERTKQAQQGPMSLADTLRQAPGDALDLIKATYKGAKDKDVYLGQVVQQSLLESGADPRLAQAANIGAEIALPGVADVAKVAPLMGGIMVGPKSQKWATTPGKFEAVFQPGIERAEISDFQSSLKMPLRSVQDVSAFESKLSEPTTFVTPAKGEGAIPLRVMDRGTTLGEVLDHPILFKHYPDLKDMRIRATKEPADFIAAYSPAGNVIDINMSRAFDPAKSAAENEKSIRSAILHEVQHKVQDTEGFAKGGSPDQFMAGVNDTYLKKYAERHEKLRNQYNELIKKGEQNLSWAERYKVYRLKNKMIELRSDAEIFMGQAKQKAYEQYQRLAGEVESRTVQSRMDMTMAERRATEPYVEQGIHPDDIITQTGYNQAKLTDDYRGTHRAPSAEGHAPAHDLTAEGIYPDDVYGTDAARFYGHGGSDVAIDQQSVGILQKMKGKPDQKVTVYRAVPKDAPDDIASGDWVTINKNYARQHGESALNGQYKIVSKDVTAKDIYTDGNSIHEWGYAPGGKLTEEPSLDAFDPSRSDRMGFFENPRDRVPVNRDYQRKIAARYGDRAARAVALFGDRTDAKRLLATPDREAGQRIIEEIIVRGKKRKPAEPNVRRVRFRKEDPGAQGARIPITIRSKKDLPFMLEQIYTARKYLDPEAAQEANVLMELDVAEAGQRIFIDKATGPGQEIISQSSTFPQWLSPSLRSRDLIDRVLKDWPNIPPAKNARERAMFEEIQNEINRRLGIQDMPYSLEGVADDAGKVIERVVGRRTGRDIEYTGRSSTLSQRLNRERNINTTTARVAEGVEEVIQRSEIDVKVKVGIQDLVRTPDRVLKKMGLEKESEQLRDAYELYLKELPVEIDKVKAWADQIRGGEANQRLFRHLDGQDVLLSPAEQKVADEIKEYLATWADRLGLPEDKRIASYITHIFEDDFIRKEFDPLIANLITDQIPGSVYDPFLQKRLGKMGYIEDTWRALDAYVKRAVRKANMDPTLAKIKDMAENMEKTQRKYIENMTKKINMQPTYIEELVDNFIKQTPIGYRFGARPTIRLTTAARRAVYRGTLGLNPGVALRNITQGVNTYSKLGERYTITGYYKLIRNLTTGHLDELYEHGILHDNLIQDRTISAVRKTMEHVDRGLFAMFDLAEKINRGSAYYGAKAKAIAEGASEEAAIQYAKKIVRDTQFVFGAVDTPPVLNGPIAKLMLQYQSFNLKQAEFLAEMITQKDLKGMVRWIGATAGMTYMLGNALGIDWKDNIPFGGYLSGEQKFGQPPTIALMVNVWKAISNQPDKFGNEHEPTRPYVPDVLERLYDSREVFRGAFAHIPGGAQGLKTYEGVKAYLEGASTSPSGRIRYPIEQGAKGLIQAALLGQYSGEIARTYFDMGLQPLGDKQSERYREYVAQGANPKKAYYFIHRERIQSKIDTMWKELQKDQSLSEQERMAKLTEFGNEQQRAMDKLAGALNLTDEERDAINQMEPQKHSGGFQVGDLSHGESPQMFMGYMTMDSFLTGNDKRPLYEDDFADLLSVYYQADTGRLPTPQEIGQIYDEHKAGKSMLDIHIDLATQGLPPEERARAKTYMLDLSARAQEITETIHGEAASLADFQVIYDRLMGGDPVDDIVATEREMVMRRMETLPGRELRPADNPGILTSIKRKAKQLVTDLLPMYGDSMFEKVARNEAAESYPFEDQVVAILPQIEFRELDPVTKFLHKGLQGTHIVENRYQLPRWMKDAAYNKLPEFIAARLPEEVFTGVGPTTPKIELRTESLTPLTEQHLAHDTIAHEVLHDVFQRVDFDLNDFNRDWDILKADNPMMQQIDTHLGTDPAYKIIQDGNQWHLATERYAYLGEALGRGGITAFPPGLARYYRGIFKQSDIEEVGIPPIPNEVAEPSFDAL